MMHIPMLALDEAPHLILHNARVWTGEAGAPEATAVAVRHHRIMAVGASSDVLALARPGTRIVDAGGASVLPGLCDAHIHLGEWSLNLRALPIAAAPSRAALLAMLAERAAQTPAGGWIVARGWNESRWGETRFPTAAELDAATGPDRPTLLYRSDLHSAVANSAALRLAGISAATPDPDGGSIDRDAAGAPTGVLRESASQLVERLRPPAGDAEVRDALRAGQAALHRLGITAVHDQRFGGGVPGALMLRCYQELRRAGALKLRVSCNVLHTELAEVEALGLQSGFGDDTLRLGHIKLFADGSLGSRTAWMLEPFAALAGEPASNTGVAMLPADQMAASFRRAAAAGCAISIHSIGDRANREVLDLFEELLAAAPPPPIPHRIEHVQTIHPADQPRLARLGLTASVQPVHCLDDMDTATLLLGERTRDTYAFAALLAAGTRLAFGSDAPVADPSPWLGLHAAVTRRRTGSPSGPAWHPEQRIDLAAALRAYTLSAAEAVGWQRTIGSIAVGKRADLVLVDRDLFALAPEEVESGALAAAQAVMTVFDGQIVFEQ